MYQQFYDFRELPFELTPNPKYLFLTRQHREALSNLQYGLFAAKAMTVLIGDAGTGKTTLLHAALQSESCRNVTCVYLNNPALTRGEFVQILSERFDLGERAARSKAVLLGELHRVLAERRRCGQITALVIDEAQSLSAELLEEIRLLANIETPTEKLLPLVIAGQTELKDRLNEPGLRQLKQRITLRCEIVPLSLEETGAYIAFRIRTAGGDASKIFTREAVQLIHEKSGGIPRTISVICDNALISGCAMECGTVDRAIVAEVARDFDFGRDGRSAQPNLEPTTPAITETGPAAQPEPQPTDPRDANEPTLFAAVAGRRRFSFFVRR
jgi:general secretion pathway protein A